MDPTATENYRILAYAHLQRGASEAAALVAREAVAVAPDSAYGLATQGYVEAQSGRPEAAREILAGLQARARASYVSPVAFATPAIALGETDDALRWLDAAHAERRGWLAYLNVDPILDPLREDCRFLALVSRMRLD